MVLTSALGHQCDIIRWFPRQSTRLLTTLLAHASQVTCQSLSGKGVTCSLALQLALWHG
jgi:hypothetical protein